MIKNIEIKAGSLVATAVVANLVAGFANAEAVDDLWVYPHEPVPIFAATSSAMTFTIYEEPREPAIIRTGSADWSEEIP